MKKSSCHAVVAVLLIVVLLGTVVLSGCTGFLGARVERNGSDPYQTPEVMGMWGASGINKSLDGYFGQVIDLIKQANSNENNELIATMRYSLEDTDEGIVLRSWFEGTEKQAVLLCDIPLSSGKATVPEDIPGYLSDTDVMRSAMGAAKAGIDVDIYAMNDTVSVSYMVSMLIQWYEHTTGTAIDHSKVVRPDIDSEDSLKLLALIPEYKYADLLTDDSANATTVMFVDTLAALMSELNLVRYGKGSDSVTLFDFVNYTELFLGMYAPVNEISTVDPETDEAETSVSTPILDRQPEDWYAVVEQTNVRNCVDNDLYEKGDAVTRLELANNMMLILNPAFRTTPFTSKRSFRDTTSANAGYAVEYGLMDCFPLNSSDFSPAYKPRYNELPVLAANLTDLCFNSWNSTGDGRYCDWLTLSDVCSGIISAESFYGALNAEVISDTELVVNDGGSDWFLQSFDTDPAYADNNTVVTAVAMIANWNGDNTSADDLRIKYLENAPGEWNLDVAAKALTASGLICLQTEKKSADELFDELRTGGSIVDELRAGKVILAPYNDTGTSTVHCMVIYGFERFGSSVRFIVNDPTISSNLIADGTLPGNAKHIEAAYAGWTIGKATGTWLVAAKGGNAQDALDVPDDISSGDTAEIVE